MTRFNISNEQQEQILNDRLTALNLDGYQQELNLLVASALGDEEQAATLQQNVEFIAKAIDAIQQLRDGLIPSAIVEPVSDPEADAE